MELSAIPGYRQGARVLSSFAYAFDPFVADVFGALSCGATFVAGDEELMVGDIGKGIKSLQIPSNRHRPLNS